MLRKFSGMSRMTKALTCSSVEVASTLEPTYSMLVFSDLSVDSRRVYQKIQLLTRPSGAKPRNAIFEMRLPCCTIRGQNQERWQK